MRSGPRWRGWSASSPSWAAPRGRAPTGRPPAWPAVPAKLLALGELEALRDALAHALARSRRELGERLVAEEHNRRLMEEMLADPASHPWVRVSHADIGEPGCRDWHVRPRFGLLGMLAGWWRVVVSSGCPLQPGGWPVLD